MADLIDRDALLRDMGLTDAVKYGNKDSEQQARSYSTWMSYEIADAIQDAPAVNRWIPVEDALPDALQNVLVCTDINTVTIAWINGDGWTFADTGGGHTENWSFADVKFWMPLPEPPKRGTENGTT